MATHASATENATTLGSLWLWIDGVGGYLICPQERIVIGQPTSDGQVDVALLGDVSRRHAIVRRYGEHYVLEALRPVSIDGQVVEGQAVLSTDCQIELGRNVRLRFTRPHPYSQTARLDFVSGHCTQPRADAVILLAETCIMGPAPSSHVRCLDWSGEVVLFRDRDRLEVAAAGDVSIDGGSPLRRGRVSSSSRVVGQGFSFSLQGRRP